MKSYHSIALPIHIAPNVLKEVFDVFMFPYKGKFRAKHILVEYKKNYHALKITMLYKKLISILILLVIPYQLI